MAAIRLAKSLNAECMPSLSRTDCQRIPRMQEPFRKHEADLLVVGLHNRDLYIARLWSTVYELAQEAPCSVLGVY
jgi:hypothetical protein